MRLRAARTDGWEGKVYWREGGRAEGKGVEGSAHWVKEHNRWRLRESWQVCGGGDQSGGREGRIVGKRGVPWHCSRWCPGRGCAHAGPGPGARTPSSRSTPRLPENRRCGGWWIWLKGMGGRRAKKGREGGREDAGETPWISKARAFFLVARLQWRLAASLLPPIPFSVLFLL